MTTKKLLSDVIIDFCNEKIVEFKTTPRDKTIQYNLGFIEGMRTVKMFIQELKSELSQHNP